MTLISKISSFVETCLGLQEFGEGQFVGSRCCKQVLLYESQTEFMDVHPMNGGHGHASVVKAIAPEEEAARLQVEDSFSAGPKRISPWLPHAGPPLMSEVFVQKLIHRSSSASSSL